MKLILELSGEHPTLPFSEAECVGDIIKKGMQVAVVDCPVPKATQRLAMTHSIIRYMGECSASYESFAEMLETLSIESDVSFAGRVKKVSDTKFQTPSLSLKDVLARTLRVRFRCHLLRGNTARFFPVTSAILEKSCTE